MLISCPISRSPGIVGVIGVARLLLFLDHADPRRNECEIDPNILFLELDAIGEDPAAVVPPSCSLKLSALNFGALPLGESFSPKVNVPKTAPPTLFGVRSLRSGSPLGFPCGTFAPPTLPRAVAASVKDAVEARILGKYCTSRGLRVARHMQMMATLTSTEDQTAAGTLS
jgi:hypothetical protein